MNDTTESLVGVPQAPRFSPGELLRAARERAGWTPERLAAELCLPLERLHALERDDHTCFGGVVFVRGYLRRAAGLLGVSPQELISAFEAHCNAANPADLMPSLPPGRLPRRGPPSWLGPLAGAVALVAVIASTWWLIGPLEVGMPTAGAPRAPATLEFAQPEEPQVARTAVTPGPVDPAPLAAEREAAVDLAPEATVEAQAVQPARAEVSVVAAQEAAAPPPGTVELRFEFSDDCWLEVIDAEERQLAYRLHRRGDVARLRGTAPVSVFLGNAAGVQLTVDGAAVPLRPARRDGTARLTVGGGAG